MNLSKDGENLRKAYTEILKKYFRDNLIKTKSDRKLTQAQIAEILIMDERSYSDLHNGKSCCSAVTLVLYLVFFCDDVDEFIDGLKDEFKKAAKDAA